MHSNTEKPLSSSICNSWDLQKVKEKALLGKDKSSAMELGHYYYQENKAKSAFWYHHAYTFQYIYPLIKHQVFAVFGNVDYIPERLQKMHRLPSGSLFERSYKRILKEIEGYEADLSVRMDKELLVKLGEKYECTGNYIKAFECYSMADEAGASEAELGIASVLMKTGDFYMGMRFLSKLAEKNNVKALNCLVRMYEEMGDKEQLLTCCIKFVELGYDEFCVRLARIYENEMELDKSIAFYERAVEYEKSQNNMFIQNKNEVRRLESKVEKLKKLYGMSECPIERLEKIYKEYAKYSELAASKLGNMYYRGENVQRNDEKSAFWYNKAYEHSLK